MLTQAAPESVPANPATTKPNARHRAPAGGSRAYEYGCRPPTRGEVDAIAQMRGRNALWNALVEISRRADAKKESFLAALDPEAVRPDDEWSKTASEAEKKARAARRKAAFAHPSLRERLDALEERVTDEAKVVSKQHALTWTNYGDVVENWMKARRPSTDPETGKRRGGDDLVSFHRFDGSGKTIQRWQQGLAVRDAGSDTQLQIDSVDPRAFSAKRAERRKYNHTTLRLRVGSDEARRPIWCETTIYVHRPLPEGCKIQRAELIRERVGTHFRWKAVFVVRLAEPLAPCASSRRPVAVEIGWRRRPDGLRVAVWTDGVESHEVTLGGNWDDDGGVPRVDDWIGAYQKSDDLESIRSTDFDTVVADLLAFLKTHDVPAWLRERTVTLARWDSEARLAALVRDWRGQRFDGDAAIFARLDGRWDPSVHEYTGWRGKDKHLYEWQSNQRDAVLRRRREQYRVLAARLARDYDTVVVERFDLAKVAKVKRRKDQPEDAPKPEGADLGAMVRHQRVMAATSILRLVLKNAFEREHGLGAYVEVEAADSTHECFWCGTVDTFDAAKELRHVCSGCGREWDQDENAARVLLRRFRERTREVVVV